MYREQEPGSNDSSGLAGNGIRNFVCQGCYRICPGNPRLEPGEQSYCGRASCQRLRKSRWDRARLKKNPQYRELRRAAKAASRRKCATAHAARLREIRGQNGAVPGPAPPPGPSATRPLSSERSRAPGPTGAIQPGWFLIRPVNAPESATQTVEVSLVWSCPSAAIEQVSSAPETDAFLLCRSASCTAEKKAS